MMTLIADHFDGEVPQIKFDLLTPTVVDLLYVKEILMTCIRSLFRLVNGHFNSYRKGYCSTRAEL